MKNILLLLFTFISFSIFAQSNEVLFSYQPFNDNFFGRQTSLTYYKSISQKAALGLRGSMRIFDQDEYLKEDVSFKVYSSNVDVLSSLNVVQVKRLRIRTEVGLSFKREFQNNHTSMIDPLFCGIGDPRFFPFAEPQLMKNSQKSNIFGYTTGLAIDFFVCKNLFLGINYNLKAYLVKQNKFSEKNIDYASMLNFNFGTKF